MSSEPTLGEYLIGVEGLALLRLAFTGDASGRAARAAEIRDLLGQLHSQARLRAPLGTEYDLQSGYQQWSATYDQPLRLFPIEEPPMLALIGSIPPGPALDAACGTGRYSTYLAEKGHSVIGVDQSEAMLDIARRKLATADFRQGDLTALPLPDNSVNAVVCALALVHVPDLAPALREFARVLRPGGRLVISDVHPFLVSLGWQAQFPARDEQRGFMRLHCHVPSEYISAANSAGMRLRSLEEPPLTETAAATPAADIVPEANRAAFVGLPAVSIWDFELTT
jgi:SAM-dependent methyltransferase